MPEENWNKQAKAILKSHLARKNMKYHDLVRELNKIGVEENQNSIATKLSRGTFSFTFFLQCMYALKISKINLDWENMH